MKKSKLIILSAMIVLCSCKNDVGENMQKVESNEITYFKDAPTGLCFAKINSVSYAGYYVSSIACVPCDSLKKIGLK